jgi:NADH dehydrogenase
VVIVGAGFGGLEAARALAGAPADVVIVDKQNHHCFQPLLYQVATAALSPADIAWPVRGLLRGAGNVSVMMAEVTGVDHGAKAVLLGARRLSYDHLVIATGATHSYFDHPDWAAHAPGLKTIEDALRLRSKLLLSFEQAEQADDAQERQRLLTFVVIGGGPTGVELAGAIAEVARHSLVRDFKRIEPASARILLIEAGPRLLGGFPERLSEYARRELTRMGVEVMLAQRVTGVRSAGVETDGGPIPSATVIWAAGVRASPAAEWLDASADRAGRIRLGSDLTVPGRENVYAIGDTAAVIDGMGASPPGVAPAAKQMGAYVGAAIRARIEGRGQLPPFVYRHQGDLATVGRKAAVVRLGKKQITGFAGWLFWSVVHVYFLIGVRNRLSVAMSWLWIYATYQRSARLITVQPGTAQALMSAASPEAALNAAPDDIADGEGKRRGAKETPTL